MGEGYSYSIYFMVSVPYVLLGTGVFFVRRMMKRAQAEAEARARAAVAAPPPSETRLDNAPAP